MQLQKLGPYRSVLLHLPLPLLERLDQASQALHMNRSEFIRRALARDLDYVMAEELSRYAGTQESLRDHHRQWLAQR